jgi:hypothetical protein
MRRAVDFLGERVEGVQKKNGRKPREKTAQVEFKVQNFKFLFTGSVSTTRRHDIDDEEVLVDVLMHI